MAVVLGAVVESDVQPVNAEAGRAHPDGVGAGVETILQRPRHGDPQGVDLFSRSGAHEGGEVWIGASFRAGGGRDEDRVAAEVGERANAIVRACEVLGEGSLVGSNPGQGRAFDDDVGIRTIEAIAGNGAGLPRDRGRRVLRQPMGERRPKLGVVSPTLQHGGPGRIGEVDRHTRLVSRLMDEVRHDAAAIRRDDEMELNSSETPIVLPECGYEAPCAEVQFTTQSEFNICATHEYQTDDASCVVDALRAGQVGEYWITDCPGGQWGQDLRIVVHADGTLDWFQGDREDLSYRWRETRRELPSPESLDDCTAGTPEDLRACLESLLDQPCVGGTPTCGGS